MRVEGEAGRWLPVTQGLPFVESANVHDGALALTMPDPERDNPRLVEALVGAGAAIRYVEPMEHSLEDVYLELVGT